MTGGLCRVLGPGVAGWSGTLWNGVPSGSVRSSGGVFSVAVRVDVPDWRRRRTRGGLAWAGVAAGPDWVPGRALDLARWAAGPCWVWVPVGGVWGVAALRVAWLVAGWLVCRLGGWLPGGPAAAKQHGLLDAASVGQRPAGGWLDGGASVTPPRGGRCERGEA